MNHGSIYLFLFFQSYKNIAKSKNKQQKQLSSIEALAVLLRNNLTKSTYQDIRNVSIEKKHDLFPPYSTVLEEKKNCYPNDITVSEFTAQVSLQNLLNHTSSRLIEYLIPVIRRIIDEDEVENGQIYEAQLITKWGFDSSTGQAIYKQSVQGETSENVCEDSLFLSSVVPLNFAISDNLIWRNDTPSSRHFCRPMKLQYVKETAEFSVAEYTNT